MTVEEMEKRLKVVEDGLKEMEKSVRVLRDIEEIKVLQYRYVNALICAEWDDCTDCFAENAKVDVYLHGLYPLACRCPVSQDLHR